MAEKRKKPVSEVKLNQVKEMKELMEKSNTFLVASIRNLPGGQYRAIKHKLKDYAKVKFLKKNIILRMLESYDKNSEKIKDYVNEDCAFLFSDKDPFELSAMLSDNLSPSKAKVGQEVPEDIKVEAGPTDLVPGPVISELGALGIPIQIEEGKIKIRESKVILKAGQKVTDAAAGIMAKLDIKPFKVGFEAVAAYDIKEDKVYTDIKINKEAALDYLKDSHSRAFAFAVSRAYPTKETIPFILAKASMHGNALSGLIKSEDKKEESSDSQENKSPEEEK
jgi:large subunit ribosomal protein L10